MPERQDDRPQKAVGDLFAQTLLPGLVGRAVGDGAVRGHPPAMLLKLLDLSADLGVELRAADGKHQLGVQILSLIHIYLTLSDAGVQAAAGELLLCERADASFLHLESKAGTAIMAAVIYTR